MRRRILLTLLASTSTVLLAFLLPLMVVVEDLAVDRIQRQVVLEVQPVVSRVPVVEHRDLDALLAGFSVESGRQATLYLSGGAVYGSLRPMDDAVLLARDRGAFFTESDQGRDLLIPIYTEDGEAVLRVAVSHAELTSAVTSARLVLVALGLLLLTLSVGLGLLLSRAFLRPIGDLSRTADLLADGDLSARVPPSDIREIDRAGRALNQLADRLVVLLGLAREEVADLAHRLRTPVAALRLDAETLPDSESGRRLHADVDRLELMVDELIHEARRPVRETLASRADLCAITRERTAFWAVLAEDQQRQMTVIAPPTPLTVAADPRDVGDALDVLIGNVFSHTAEGVAFRVSVGTAPGRRTAWLCVADDGPGITDEGLIARGRSESGSTGLGLDIARRVAERSGGSISVDTGRDGGAVVRLDLKLAPSA